MSEARRGEGGGRRRRRRVAAEPNVMALSDKQRKGLLLLLLPLMFMVYLGWQQLTAAVFDYQSQRWLAHWSEQKKVRDILVIRQQDFNAAVNGAKKAVVMQPRNGQYMARLASIYDWYVLHGRRDKPEYAEAKVQTLIWFRKAIEARPNWPESRFDLALAKARQQTLDAEFDEAFIASLQLGPWEERLQYRAADLSLLLYRYVKPEVREAMAANWQRMAQHQPGRLLQLAKQYRALPQICRYFTEPQPRVCVRP